MQTTDCGLLAVLPLLTPIGCDAEARLLEDNTYDDEEDSEVSEDRRCTDALVRVLIWTGAMCHDQTSDPFVILPTAALVMGDGLTD